MVNIQNFLDDNNRVNWSAYRRAQRSAGEICCKCDGFIPLGRSGPVMCYSCEQLSNNVGSVTSETFVRCPHCSCQQNVYDNEWYELYNEGEHTVACDSCGQDYQVSTQVTYTFTSPEKISTEPEP